MSRAITLAGYAVVVAALVACEVAARRGRDVATFAAAVKVLTRRRPAQVLVLAGWLWLGWHLFVRASH